MKFSDLKYLVIQSGKEWSEDKASRLAASLAYYTVFSIPPLLIIVLAISSRVFDDAEARITAEITNFIGETGGEAITAILENASAPGETIIAAVVSIITLLLGASGVFGQLQDAMNTVWEVKPDPDRGWLATLKARFFSFTMVLGVGFLLLVALIVSSTLTAFNEFVTGIVPGALIVASIINFVVSLFVVTLLFALIFKVVPDVEIAWHDVWIGALATAVLFTLGKSAISIYLARSAPASTYGAAGSLIIILLWVYYSAQILFLGAEFTQVYANAYGSYLKPERGAVALTEADKVQQGIPSEERVERKQEETESGGRRAISTTTYRPPTPVPQPPAAVQVSANKFHHAVVAALSVPTAIWQFLRRD